VWNSFCISMEEGSRGWKGSCKKIVFLPLLTAGVVGVLGGAGVVAALVVVVIDEYLVMNFLKRGRSC